MYKHIYVYICMFLVLIKGTFHESIPNLLPALFCFVGTFTLLHCLPGQVSGGPGGSYDSAAVVGCLLVLLSGLRGLFQIELLCRLFLELCRLWNAANSTTGDLFRPCDPSARPLGECHPVMCSSLSAFSSACSSQHRSFLLIPLGNLVSRGWGIEKQAMS